MCEFDAWDEMEDIAESMEEFRGGARSTAGWACAEAVIAEGRIDVGDPPPG